MDTDWLGKLDSEFRAEVERESWVPPEGAFTAPEFCEKTGWKRTKTRDFLLARVDAGVLGCCKHNNIVYYMDPKIAPEWAKESGRE